MTTKKTGRNSYNDQEMTIHHKSSPKTYSYTAYVISQVINSISIIFVTIAIMFTLFFYGHVFKRFFSSKTAVDSKFPFEVLTPDFFISQSYFIDQSLKTTIEAGLNSSQEIAAIANQPPQSGDPFRSIEELNRQRFILISGDPGTGKTFTTKALLGSLPPNYLIINIVPSALQSKFIGESAKNLAGIFKYITANQNTKENLQFIVFFDECDTLLETSKEKMGTEPIINQFLLIAGGDDKIKRLPFVCIFTTNTNIHQMMERGHRRFTHVTPALMDQRSLITVFRNYSEDHEMLKEINDLSDFCFVFKNQVLQFPLDFLKRVCEEPYGDVEAEFRRQLENEKRKKERIFRNALEELQENVSKFVGNLFVTVRHVEELNKKKDKRIRNEIRDCVCWVERLKQKLQSLCVEFRRVNRFAPVPVAGEENEIPILRQNLEAIIEKFRETAEMLEILKNEEIPKNEKNA